MIETVTNLRAALGRFASGPLVAVYVLPGGEHWVWRKRTRFRGGNFKVSV